jgi:hypothetical protein
LIKVFFKKFSNNIEMALTKAATPKIAHIIDPIYYLEKSRAEFRLSPGTAYFADLRLIDIGISSAAGNTEYNGLLGAESPIEQISIMDGGVTIEALNRAQYLRAWQKLQSSNDGNISVGRETTHNALGYIVNGKLDNSATTFGQGQNAQTIPAVPTNQVSANTAKAWISLRDMFPFLAANPILPTNIFKDFRVVVQFSDAQALTNLVKNSALADLSTSRPLMLAEELEASDEKVKAMAQYEGVRWFSWEHDQFRLDALANPPNTTLATSVGDEVAVTQRMRGFTGKYLQSLVIQCTPTLLTSYRTGNNNKLFGQYGSKSLFRPSFNVRVNGANKIPREGLVGKNRRLAGCTDVLGNWNVPSFQIYNGFIFNNGLSADLQTSIGAADFTALDIEDYCEDLQVTIRRSAGHAQVDLNQAINVSVWGHVSKALIVNASGDYVIVNTNE